VEPVSTYAPDEHGNFHMQKEVVSRDELIRRSIDLPALLAKAKAATPHACGNCPTEEWTFPSSWTPMLQEINPTTIAALVEELMRARELLELAVGGIEWHKQPGDVGADKLVREIRAYLAARKEAT